VPIDPPPTGIFVFVEFPDSGSSVVVVGASDDGSNVGGVGADGCRVDMFSVG
jgi:hypothetical protein